MLAVFAISFLGVWQSALAIEINEAELAQMRIVSPDLTVDKLNIDGWTSFMHAIQGHEVQVVRDLLKKGASLNLLPDCVKYEYANAFEYLYDLGIGFGSGEHKAWAVTETAREDYYEIVDIILKHCIANGKCLKVNRVLLKHDDGILTVWSEHGEQVYKELLVKYLNLFS